MSIRITEKMYNDMKSNLHYKDELSKHELVIALSDLTYAAARMEANETIDTINPEWRKNEQ